MSMPEEINRILTDQISDILFCPTVTAINNLKNEGFKNKKCSVINVGDVMYDAAMYYLSKSKKPLTLGNDLKKFALVTIHRADNTNNIERLTGIVNALNEINLSTPVVCPVHPRTKKILLDSSVKPTFTMVDPVSYFEMIWLLQNCSIVITDSGGLQKEAYFFNKYCITMRDQTEWVELVDAGVNKLVGASTKAITAELSRVQGLTDLHHSFKNKLYGEGNAAQLIIQSILEHSE
jgi:UDP-GlcNAc3NAcA epimerase